MQNILKRNFRKKGAHIDVMEMLRELDKVENCGEFISN